jgi:hypothetical protein
MRRLAVAFVVVFAAGMSSGDSGLAADSARTTRAPAESLQADLTADFDGDGFADLAVGVFEEAVGGIYNAGAVNVLYGTPTGLTGSGSQLFTQDSAGVGGAAEKGDSFGAALAVGDFDDDGFADLAVGVPGESLGTAESVGAVNVLYGSTTGLTGSGSQTFTQNTSGVVSTAEVGDSFGDALTAGDFDGDGFTDLAVGASGESVGSVLDGRHAGAVNVLYGSTAGLTGSGSQLFTQDSSGVGSTVERDDAFGFALTGADFDHDGFADVAVGVPIESIGSIIESGAVSVLYGSAAGLTGSGSQFFTQNSPGVGSTAERGDFFGWAVATGDFDSDGFADLAVGVPSEDIGRLVNTGAVNVLPGSAAGLTGTGSQTFTQNSTGVGSSAEEFDGFGFALSVGDFDSDGSADLAVGVPFEDIGSVVDAGLVNVLYGNATGLTGAASQFFTQNSTGAGSTAEEDDYLGYALSVGDFDNDGSADLAVGVPFEDIGSTVNTGAVNVLPGSATGLTGTGSQFFTQDTAGVGSSAEEFDLFGFALAASGAPGPTAA